MISIRIYGCGGGDGGGNNNDFRIDINCCDARLFAICHEQQMIGRHLLAKSLFMGDSFAHRQRSPNPIAIANKCAHTVKMNVFGQAVWNRLIKSVSFFALALFSRVSKCRGWYFVRARVLVCMQCGIGQNACWHFPFFFVHRRREAKKKKKKHSIRNAVPHCCGSSSLPECNRDETSLRDTISHAAAMLHTVHSGVCSLQTAHHLQNDKSSVAHAFQLTCHLMQFSTLNFFSSLHSHPSPTISHTGSTEWKRFSRTEND